MAIDNSNTDDLKDQNQSSDNKTFDDVEQVEHEDHSCMWWLNIRRRCHKHSNIKRNHIRRKH